MAKYKVKSLSVNLGNRVIRKAETKTIDGEKFPATEIVAAEKAGFIEKVKEKSSGQKTTEKPKTNSGGNENKTNEKG